MKNKNSLCQIFFFFQILLFSYIPAPPDLAPRLTINNKVYQDTDKTTDFAYLQVDETFSIDCTADGGFPQTTDIRVMCGGEIVAGKEMNFSINKNATKCSCSASHVSGCYEKNRTEVTIICK